MTVKRLRRLSIDPRLFVDLRSFANDVQETVDKFAEQMLWDHLVLVRTMGVVRMREMVREAWLNFGAAKLPEDWPTRFFLRGGMTDADCDRVSLDGFPMVAMLEANDGTQIRCNFRDVNAATSWFHTAFSHVSSYPARPLFFHGKLFDDKGEAVSQF